MDHLAHVKQRDDGTWDHHPLEEHLRCVSSLAGDSAAVFASAEWGRLAGLWHDLGKYQPEFQKYIRSASGFDAHIETAPGKVKHAIAGAIHGVEIPARRSFSIKIEQAAKKSVGRLTW